MELKNFLTRKLINLRKIDEMIENFVIQKEFEKIINLFQEVFGIQPEK